MELKEKYTLSLIKDKVNVVFDVGARIDGNEFIEIVPSARFHFFEPNITFSNELTTKLASYTNVTVNQFGLWNENLDNVTYYENVQSFIPHPFIDSVDSGLVFDLRTVDWYVAKHKISSIDFMKIDTEGGDYNILLGASKSIEKNLVKFIQFEYWDGVQRFYDLLHDRYDMYFIEGADSTVLTPLTPEVVHNIDYVRIPAGLGGDIFCAHKQEMFTI